MRINKKIILFVSHNESKAFRELFDFAIEFE